MATVYQLQAIDKDGKVFLHAHGKSIYLGFEQKDLTVKKDFDLVFLLLQTLDISVEEIKIIRRNDAFLYQALIVREDGSKHERVIPLRLAYSFVGYSNIPLYIEAELFDSLAKK